MRPCPDSKAGCLCDCGEWGEAGAGRGQDCLAVAMSDEMGLVQSETLGGTGVEGLVGRRRGMCARLAKCLVEVFVRFVQCIDVA